MSEATRKLSDARELLNKAKLRRELVELRAESDATVQSVAKVSVGSVMQSGQHFFTLVPAAPSIGSAPRRRRIPLPDSLTSPASR
jgi:HlyD family secretion protein